MDGDLTRRLPQAGEGDEFDRLAATLNTMLGRIEALMQAQRQVTDDIAHDLRTPLARLRQRIESALASARDPETDAATLEDSLTELDQVLASAPATNDQDQRKAAELIEHIVRTHHDFTRSEIDRLRRRLMGDPGDGRPLTLRLRPAAGGCGRSMPPTGFAGG